MKTFNYSAIREQKWDSDVLGLIAAIYKEAGKQELYLKQRPEELEKLVEIAKIQSTEASNAIEGIVTTSTRIRQLVEEKTTPRNRDEQEIAGYRDVLSIIHESFDAIPITQNYILQLHKILYSHMNNPLAGRTKITQNYITATYPDGHVETLFTPLAPYETPEALDRICAEYNRVIGNMELEPLIAIPVFIHDFLCIHPFNDGNGRMSRLLTTLLLYQNGFYVGKYISLEAKIAKNKDLYYAVLAQAQIGWHEGTEDVVPFIKYLLGTILAAYKDFEDRVALVETKLPALEMVRRASKNRIGRFNKQDIRELCPTLSDSSIEGALRKLVAARKMKKEGKTDETHEINIKKAQINNFFTEEVKKFARKTREIKVRIVFVKLKTGETETLFTNLPKEIATPEELKELYGTRWTIEKNYDRLKNKLHIEKFTGKKKIIIEQDFYSHIYLLNILIALKHDAEEEITRKPKETTKYKYVYKSNVNTLIGNIKEEMPRLLTDDKEEIKQIVEEILDIARKDLVYTKIKAPTNKERDKKKYYHKKCKSNIQNSF